MPPDLPGLTDRPRLTGRTTVPDRPGAPQPQFRPVRPWLRPVLTAVGAVSLGLGLLGLFLPLLPTTPFVLLTAACWGRSSPRFHAWLLRNPLVGPTIADWQTYGAISLRAKVLAIATLAVTLGLSIAFVVPLVHAQVALGLLGLAVALYLARLPTRPRARPVTVHER